MVESIAIGSFDGIHLAHQELIKRVETLLVIEKGLATLTPSWKRSLYTDREITFYHFEAIKMLSPKEFIDKIQSDFPHLRKIVVGYDFIFGRDRAGDIATLKKLFNGVEVVAEVKLDGKSIHSRTIKEAIKRGDIKNANRMLGRRYRVDGKEIKGLGLGSKELVPTINLDVKRYLLPIGVFAVNVNFENYSCKDSKRVFQNYKAICFVGNRITVDNSFSVEFHILEKFKKPKNGTRIWIEFVDFIRANRKFNSLKELKEAILKDIETAKRVLRY